MLALHSAWGALTAAEWHRHVLAGEQLVEEVDSAHQLYGAAIQELNACFEGMAVAEQQRLGLAVVELEHRAAIGNAQLERRHALERWFADPTHEQQRAAIVVAEARERLALAVAALTAQADVAVDAWSVGFALQELEGGVAVQELAQEVDRLSAECVGLRAAGELLASQARGRMALMAEEAAGWGNALRRMARDCWGAQQRHALGLQETVATLTSDLEATHAMYTEALQELNDAAEQALHNEQAVAVLLLAEAEARKCLVENAVDFWLTCWAQKADRTPDHQMGQVLSEEQAARLGLYAAAVEGWAQLYAWRASGLLAEAERQAEEAVDQLGLELEAVVAVRDVQEGELEHRLRVTFQEHAEASDVLIASHRRLCDAVQQTRGQVQCLEATLEAERQQRQEEVAALCSGFDDRLAHCTAAHSLLLAESAGRADVAAEWRSAATAISAWAAALDVQRHRQYGTLLAGEAEGRQRLLWEESADLLALHHASAASRVAIQETLADEAVAELAAEADALAAQHHRASQRAALEAAEAQARRGLAEDTALGYYGLTMTLSLLLAAQLSQAHAADQTAAEELQHMHEAYTTELLELGRLQELDCAAHRLQLEELGERHVLEVQWMDFVHRAMRWWEDRQPAVDCLAVEAAEAVARCEAQAEAQVAMLALLTAFHRGLAVCAVAEQEAALAEVCAEVERLAEEAVAGVAQRTCLDAEVGARHSVEAEETAMRLTQLTTFIKHQHLLHHLAAQETAASHTTTLAGAASQHRAALQAHDQRWHCVVAEAEGRWAVVDGWREAADGVWAALADRRVERLVGRLEEEEWTARLDLVAHSGSIKMAIVTCEYSKALDLLRVQADLDVAGLTAALEEVAQDSALLHSLQDLECQAWAKKYAVQGEEEAGQVGLWAAQLWAVSAHHRNVVEDLREEIQVATDLCNTQLEELAALCDETVAHERSAARLVADEVTARAGIEAECAAWCIDVWTAAADRTGDRAMHRLAEQEQAARSQLLEAEWGAWLSMARSLTVHDLQVRDDALAALTEELREADRLYRHALEQTVVLEAEAESRMALMEETVSQVVGAWQWGWREAVVEAGREWVVWKAAVEDLGLELEQTHTLYREQLLELDALQEQQGLFCAQQVALLAAEAEGRNRVADVLWDEVCSHWQRLADRTVDRQLSLVAMAEAEERRRLTQAEAEESLAALGDAWRQRLRLQEAAEAEAVAVLAAELDAQAQELVLADRRAALWGVALEGRRVLTDTEGVARTAIVWETQREWREAEIERLHLMYSDALTELEETHGNDVQRQQDWAVLLLAEQEARIDLQAQYEAELLACWVGEVAPVKQRHCLAEWETMGRCTLLQTQLQDCLALLGDWHSLQQRRRAAETAAQHAVLADQQRRDAALRALQAEEADHRRGLSEDAAVAMAAVVGQCARHAWEAAGREVVAAQGLCDAAVEELALLQEGEVAGLRQIATLELDETEGRRAIAADCAHDSIALLHRSAAAARHRLQRALAAEAEQSARHRLHTAEGAARSAVAGAWHRGQAAVQAGAHEAARTAAAQEGVLWEEAARRPALEGEARTALLEAVSAHHADAVRQLLREAEATHELYGAELLALEAAHQEAEVLWRATQDVILAEGLGRLAIASDVTNQTLDVWQAVYNGLYVRPAAHLRDEEAVARLAVAEGEGLEWADLYAEHRCGTQQLQDTEELHAVAQAWEAAYAGAEHRSAVAGLEAAEATARAALAAEAQLQCMQTCTALHTAALNAMGGAHATAAGLAAEVAAAHATLEDAVEELAAQHGVGLCWAQRQAALAAEESNGRVEVWAEATATHLELTTRWQKWQQRLWEQQSDLLGREAVQRLAVARAWAEELLAVARQSFAAVALECGQTLERLDEAALIFAGELDFLTASAECNELEGAERLRLAYAAQTAFALLWAAERVAGQVVEAEVKARHGLVEDWWAGFLLLVEQAQQAQGQAAVVTTEEAHHMVVCELSQEVDRLEWTVTFLNLTQEEMSQRLTILTWFQEHREACTMEVAEALRADHWKLQEQHGHERRSIELFLQEAEHRLHLLSASHDDTAALTSTLHHHAALTYQRLAVHSAESVLRACLAAAEAEARVELSHGLFRLEAERLESRLDETHRVHAEHLLELEALGTAALELSQRVGQCCEAELTHRLAVMTEERGAMGWLFQSGWSAVFRQWAVAGILQSEPEGRRSLLDAESRVVVGLVLDGRRGREALAVGAAEERLHTLCGEALLEHAALQKEALARQAVLFDLIAAEQAGRLAVLSAWAAEWVGRGGPPSPIGAAMGTALAELGRAEADARDTLCAAQQTIADALHLSAVYSRLQLVEEEAHAAVVEVAAALERAVADHGDREARGALALAEAEARIGLGLEAGGGRLAVCAAGVKQLISCHTTAQQMEADTQRRHALAEEEAGGRRALVCEEAVQCAHLTESSMAYQWLQAICGSSHGIHGQHSCGPTTNGIMTLIAREQVCRVAHANETHADMLALLATHAAALQRRHSAAVAALHELYGTALAELDGHGAHSVGLAALGQAEAEARRAVVEGQAAEVAALLSGWVGGTMALASACSGRAEQTPTDVLPVGPRPATNTATPSSGDAEAGAEVGHVEGMAGPTEAGVRAAPCEATPAALRALQRAELFARLSLLDMAAADFVALYSAVAHAALCASPVARPSAGLPDAGSATWPPVCDVVTVAADDSAALNNVAAQVVNEVRLDLLGETLRRTVEERTVAVEAAEAQARHQLTEVAADGCLQALCRLLKEVRCTAQEAATQQAAEAETLHSLYGQELQQLATLHDGDLKLAHQQYCLAAAEAGGRLSISEAAWVGWPQPSVEHSPEDHRGPAGDRTHGSVEAAATHISEASIAAALLETPPASTPATAADVPMACTLTQEELTARERLQMEEAASILSMLLAAHSDVVQMSAVWAGQLEEAHDLYGGELQELNEVHHREFEAECQQHAFIVAEADARLDLHHACYDEGFELAMLPHRQPRLTAHRLSHDDGPSASAGAASPTTAGVAGPDLLALEQRERGQLEGAAAEAGLCLWATALQSLRAQHAEQRRRASLDGVAAAVVAAALTDVLGELGPGQRTATELQCDTACLEAAEAEQRAGLMVAQWEAAAAVEWGRHAAVLRSQAMALAAAQDREAELTMEVATLHDLYGQQLVELDTAHAAAAAGHRRRAALCAAEAEGRTALLWEFGAARAETLMAIRPVAALEIARPSGVHPLDEAANRLARQAILEAAHELLQAAVGEAVELAAALGAAHRALALASVAAEEQGGRAAVAASENDRWTELVRHLFSTVQQLADGRLAQHSAEVEELHVLCGEQLAELDATHEAAAEAERARQAVAAAEATGRRRLVWEAAVEAQEALWGLVGRLSAAVQDGRRDERAAGLVAEAIQDALLELLADVKAKAEADVEAEPCVVQGVAPHLLTLGGAVHQEEGVHRWAVWREEQEEWYGVMEFQWAALLANNKAVAHSLRVELAAAHTAHSAAVEELHVLYGEQLAELDATHAAAAEAEQARQAVEAAEAAERLHLVWEAAAEVQATLLRHHGVWLKDASTHLHSALERHAATAAVGAVQAALLELLGTVQADAAAALAEAEAAHGQQAEGWACEVEQLRRELAIRACLHAEALARASLAAEERGAWGAAATPFLPPAALQLCDAVVGQRLAAASAADKAHLATTLDELHAAYGQQLAELAEWHTGVEAAQRTQAELCAAEAAGRFALLGEYCATLLERQFLPLHGAAIAQRDTVVCDAVAGAMVAAHTEVLQELSIVTQWDIFCATCDVAYHEHHSSLLAAYSAELEGCLATKEDASMMRDAAVASDREALKAMGDLLEDEQTARWSLCQRAQGGWAELAADFFSAVAQATEDTHRLYSALLEELNGEHEAARQWERAAVALQLEEGAARCGLLGEAAGHWLAGCGRHARGTVSLAGVLVSKGDARAAVRVAEADARAALVQAGPTAVAGREAPAEAIPQTAPIHASGTADRLSLVQRAELAGRLILIDSAVSGLLDIAVQTLGAVGRQAAAAQDAYGRETVVRLSYTVRESEGTARRLLEEEATQTWMALCLQLQSRLVVAAEHPSHLRPVSASVDYYDAAAERLTGEAVRAALEDVAGELGAALRWQRRRAEVAGAEAAQRLTLWASEATAGAELQRLARAGVRRTADSRVLASCQDSESCTREHIAMAEAMSRATLAQAWTASQAGVWAASVAALQHVELDGRHALQEEALLRRWEAASSHVVSLHRAASQSTTAEVERLHELYGQELAQLDDTHLRDLRVATAVLHVSSQEADARLAILYDGWAAAAVAGAAAADLRARPWLAVMQAEAVARAGLLAEWLQGWWAICQADGGSAHEAAVRCLEVEEAAARTAAVFAELDERVTAVWGGPRLAPRPPPGPVGATAAAAGPGLAAGRGGLEAGVAWGAGRAALVGEEAEGRAALADRWRRAAVPGRPPSVSPHGSIEGRAQPLVRPRLLERMLYTYELWQEEARLEEEADTLPLPDDFPLLNVQLERVPCL